MALAATAKLVSINEQSVPVKIPGIGYAQMMTSVSQFGIAPAKHKVPRLQRTILRIVSFRSG